MGAKLVSVRKSVEILEDAGRFQNLHAATDVRRSVSQFFAACCWRSCGAAREGSPRREPWGWCGCRASPGRGARVVEGRGSAAAPQLATLFPEPTAHAVGYSLPPLRGFPNHDEKTFLDVFLE